ncbi:MAG: exonuclease SbcCD subunit D [Thermoleophilia bacterium]
MRFIHTGDWHLGRLFHNLHLTDDQRFTLEGLVRLAEDKQVDGLVVAGDVYDRAVPPTQAVTLLDDILAEFALRLKVPVVIIAGNHDSPVRIQYLNGLVSRVGVHVIGAVGEEPTGVSIVGRDGVEVMFWPLAYTDPETARCDLCCDDIHTHEEALRAQLGRIRSQMKEDARHVVVGHAFVTGAKESESERPLTVGGTGQVSHEVFEGFDYVALGHLHRPQVVSDRVRYAGSLLKYSFDEADHEKSVAVIDIDKDGNITVSEEALPIRRDLVRLRGTFDELLAKPDAAECADAYVEVTLVESEAVLDPMERLRDVYPHIVSLRRESLAGELDEGERRPVEGRSTKQLFGDFFEDVTGAGLTSDQEAELESTFAEIARELREVVA